MRKLLLILTLLWLVGPLKSQTIFTSFQPDDKGIGIGYRTDKLYVSVSHGEYKLNKGYMEHSKIALGGVLCPKYSIHSGQSFITYGACLHSYNHYNIPEFKPIVLFPVSFEAGAGCYIGKVMVGFNFDFIKNESSLYFGVKLH